MLSKGAENYKIESFLPNRVPPRLPGKLAAQNCEEKIDNFLPNRVGPGLPDKFSAKKLQNYNNNELNLFIKNLNFM